MSVPTDNQTLPMQVEEITADWLSQALGCPVETVDVTEVIWGTATKVLARVHFADGRELGVCVKGGFNPELMQQMGATYQIEARFYRDLGTRLESGVPACYFAGVDAQSGQGIVVLENLSARKPTFGDPRDPITPDQAAAALEGQASWHATIDGLPEWLPTYPLWRPVIDGLLTEDRWTAECADGKARRLPPELQDRDRYLGGLHESWRSDDQTPPCLVHGDTNITNLVFTEGARPWFLDWQLAAATHWAHDVALFVIGSLTIADRREHERDLIRHYVEARNEYGDAPRLDQAFEDYRRHALHGLMYAFIPDAMQPPEVCLAFSERFAAAITDHDTLGLLEVR